MSVHHVQDENSKGRDFMIFAWTLTSEISHFLAAGREKNKGKICSLSWLYFSKAPKCNSNAIPLGFAPHDRLDTLALRIYQSKYESEFGWIPPIFPEFGILFLRLELRYLPGHSPQDFLQNIFIKPEDLVHSPLVAQCGHFSLYVSASSHCIA